MCSGVGSSVVSATGPSESTQASAVLPPRCRLTARASALSAMRTKPPGITDHLSPVRERNSRRMNGRGCKPAVMPGRHGRQASRLPARRNRRRGRRSRARCACGVARRRVAHRACLRRPASARWSPNAGAITMRVEPVDHLVAHVGTGRATRSRRSAGSGPRPTTAGASAGRKASSARASATPVAERIGDDDLAVAHRLHQAG